MISDVQVVYIDVITLLSFFHNHCYTNVIFIQMFRSIFIFSLFCSFSYSLLLFVVTCVVKPLRVFDSSSEFEGLMAYLSGQMYFRVGKIT